MAKLEPRQLHNWLEVLRWLFRTARLARAERGTEVGGAAATPEKRRNLTVTLPRVYYGARHYFVRMNGQRWPAHGQAVSLTCLFTALRKSLVNSGPAE